MKLKKFLSLLMVAALFVGFTACSNDDDDSNIPNQVTGTWKFSKLEPVVESSDAEAKAIATATMQALLADVQLPAFTIIFNADGTCDLTADGIGQQQGTYTYANGKLTVSGDLFLLELAGDAESINFNVTQESGKLALELDMKQILAQAIEDIKEKLTKFALAITLDPA
ncbi:MAG: hypothetical protein LBG19_09235 [Prevotellaceae bacterium]|jgi:hypothetical protein|nr:hypothetical protein [Prevotellaceae bacterium]